jgi:hypothetical protein
MALRGSDPDALMEFLLTPIPWCRHCDFDSFEMFPWGPSRGELSEWLSEVGDGSRPADDAGC